MGHKYGVIFLYPTKVGRIPFCCALILTLFSLSLISEAAPTGQLAYAVNGFDENLGRFDWNLYTTAIRGTKDLKAIPLNHKGVYPAWGREGELLYFIQWHGGQADVYSIDPESPKNKKRVTQISGTYRFLTVSPNGKKLAFNGWTMEQLPQDNQIWLLDTETGEMEVMTQVPHFGWPYSFWGISWSPNGKKLAFSLSRPGWLEHLYILDIETKEIEILTELNKDFYPVWSPDGQRILFFRWNREFDTFCTIDVETKAITTLFDVDKATGYWADWSPEGDYMIYSRWGTVYLYDFESEDTEELVEIEGSVFVISWLRDIRILPVEPRKKLVTTWGDIKQGGTQ
ncbi:PD40 domain-containing protein [Candidatus Poribacteria bacterium]|nr:PD40 domain-containing protein [Candidatus Poribacteria bacterium]